MEQSDLLLSLKAKIAADRIRVATFNPAQYRSICAIDEPEVVIILDFKGNGSGKTFVNIGAIMGAIIFGTANPLFATKMYQEWPYVKSARIMAPVDLLKDNGPIQKAIKTLWPTEKYSQRRGSGKGYYSEGETTTGWDWDVVTYNQTPLQAAGYTKSLIVCSEPPPEAHFGEMIGRLRAGGIVIIEATPLNYAAYLQDLAEEGVIRDPETNKVIGKIVLVGGDIHENCRDHYEGGQLSHAAIMRTIASWPIEEREARRSGSFMQLAGRIYTQWGENNIWKEMPAYHQEMFDKGKFNLYQMQDPHDRKPFAVIWTAVFPNDDVVVISEWPTEEYPPFHKIRMSPISDIDDYRDIYLATEAELGKTPDRRIEDPKFGAAPKLGGKSVQELFADPCATCVSEGKKKECKHRLYFQHPETDKEFNLKGRHLMVRTAIGNVKEKRRPKLYAMDWCRNFNYGMKRYGYKENGPGKALSEKPDLIHKDYPDTIGWLYHMGLDTYRGPRVSRPPRTKKFKRRANA